MLVSARSNYSLILGWIQNKNRTILNLFVIVEIQVIVRFLFWQYTFSKPVYFKKKKS